MAAWVSVAILLGGNGFPDPHPSSGPPMTPQDQPAASMDDAGPAVASSNRIPLHVQEEFGCSREEEPVTTGLPFPAGVIREAGQARVLDPAGAEIPSQRRVLARWRDGSVKWLLLDFRASVGAGQTRIYQLEYGPQVRAATVAGGLKITKENDRLIVDAGRLRFMIRLDRFTLMDELDVDLDGNGRFGRKETLIEPGSGQGAFVELEHAPPGPPQEENWLRDESGGPREHFVAIAGPPALGTSETSNPGTGKAGDFVPGSDFVRMEEEGPLRAVIAVHGTHRSASGRSFAPFVLRITAYAGQAYLKLSHFFYFDGEPKEDFIRAFGLRFPFSLGTKIEAVLGGEAGETIAVRDDAAAASLAEGVRDRFYHLVPWTEDRAVRFRVTEERSESRKSGPAPRRLTREGKEAAGWAGLSGKRAAVFMALRDFWQLHPKEIRVERDPASITFYLWPEEGGKVLDLRRRYDHVDNDTHYDLSLFEYGGQGVGKTHEILLAAGPTEALRSQAGALQGFLNRSLVAYVSPEWYQESKALLDYALRDRANAPKREALIDLMIEWILRNPVEFHWDGMLDYGDTLFHGLETPTHAGFKAEKAWASRGYVGWQNNDGNLAHALWLHYLRTGDRRLFRRAESMSRHLMDVDTCHGCRNPAFIGGVHRHDQQHWGNGVRGYGTDAHAMAEMYYLTGDRRAADTLHEFARFHWKGQSDEDENRVGCLARAFEATGCQEYLDAARQAAESDYYGFRLGEAGCLDQPHFRTAADLVQGFRFYHSITGDDRIPRLFQEAARRMAEGVPTSGYALAVLSAAYLFDRDPLTLKTLQFCLGSFDPYGEHLFQAFDPEKELPRGAAALTWDELVALVRRLPFLNNNYVNAINLQTFPLIIRAGQEALIPEKDLPFKGYRLQRMGVGSDWGYAGEKIPPGESIRFVPIDLSTVANRNPLADPLVRDPASESDPGLNAGEIGFDFGEYLRNASSFGHTAAGCLPVRQGMIYPYAEIVPGPREHDWQTFYGLPFGVRMEFCGVPFHLPDPHPLRSSLGRAGEVPPSTSIFLGKNQSVTIPLPEGTVRLRLLGHVCLKGGILPEAGAEYILRYQDNIEERIPLTKLMDYEWFTGWGFCTRARLARQWKVAGSWDGGDGVLLNLFTIEPKRPAPTTVTLRDTGPGHGLVLLAATAEVRGKDAETPILHFQLGTGGQPRLSLAETYDPARRCGWVGNTSALKDASDGVLCESQATLRLDLPAGAYDLEMDLAGTGGGSPMVSLSADGTLLCRKFSLSTAGIDASPAFEKIRMPVTVSGDHTLIHLARDRQAGAYRHPAFVRSGGWKLRELAVYARPEGGLIPLPAVRYGWVEADLDWKLPILLPEVQGDWMERDACRCYGSRSGSFRADLPDGEYELEFIFAAVGPMNVSVQGKKWLENYSVQEKPVRHRLPVSIRGQPLLVSFERVGDQGCWGLSGLKARQRAAVSKGQDRIK
ncbi:MAG: hypothetical protein HYU36_01675 [Planctomycetes bacterium]|nr:hypothetical protein [Planctomycetota bacterium]